MTEMIMVSLTFGDMATPDTYAWLGAGAQDDFMYHAIEADEDGLIVVPRVRKGGGRGYGKWTST